MKTVAIALFALLFSTAVYVSIPVEEKVCKSGICVVEFNASFNSNNSVSWIEDLNDCATSRVDIVAAPDLQREHKIVVVPTIVVFKRGRGGKEIPGQHHDDDGGDQGDVQEAVDEVLMSDF